MQGFLVVQFEKNFESAGKQLAQWVKEGKIKTKPLSQMELTKFLTHSETYLLEKTSVNK